MRDIYKIYTESMISKNIKTGRRGMKSLHIHSHVNAIINTDKN